MNSAYAFNENTEQLHLVSIPNRPITEAEMKELVMNQSFNRIVNLFCGSIMLIFFLLLSTLACPTIMDDELKLSDCALAITITAGILGGLSIIIYAVFVCRHWYQLR